LAVRRAYDDLNQTLFRGALVRPLFELSSVEGRFGRWVGRTRTLELSRELLVTKGWGVLVEVLKHEMAHQYVDEALGIGDEGPHGAAFRRVCAERGIDARATGTPPHHPGDAHVLDRISKLLALAESPNEHEAQAAMNAAQRLMLKYNIESAPRAGPAGYGFRHLGVPTGRVGESQRQLALLLGEHFFVEVIWVPVWRPLEGKRGTVLEVCGSAENLELAAYVHAFVTHTGARLLRDYRARHPELARGQGERFLSGLVSGFREKLALQKRKNAREGLVFVGDSELSDYLRSRHPRVRTTHHRITTSGHAYARGREAGKNLVLHRGVRAGAAGGPPRLLPGKR